MPHGTIGYRQRHVAGGEVRGRLACGQDRTSIEEAPLTAGARYCERLIGCLKRQVSYDGL